MKSLYESILSSTKSGKSEYLRTLFDTPDRNDAINKEWSNLSLGLDLGQGEGYWRYDKNTKTYYFSFPKNKTLMPAFKLIFFSFKFKNIAVIAVGT